MQSLSRLPHLVRGSSAAAIATFAALFSHVLGGGAMPGPLGIVVPLLLSLMVSVLLAGRKLSLIRLSVSVVTSQILFHSLFVLGTPASGAASQSEPPSPHHAHGMMPMPMPMPMPMLSEHSMTQMHSGFEMWIAHLVGAVVTIAFLYRGERAIHHLHRVTEQFIAWVRHRFTPTIQVPALWAPAPAPVQPAEAKGWTVLSQIHASTLSRRGPPAVHRIAS
ncbi:hypothetical protein ICM05_07410 [Leucobacter sp. cx-42]|uniref:hypothetical protein n=1 Tax=unclassified Leucobacter TaxID=2621730 RepID=UPI00165E5FFA|nr:MULTISPECIES: hypothetical protein [unclassified Leucobacter]MBC9954475.1 hypothetical protein [Leucobacter sp. cx-42]